MYLPTDVFYYVFLSAVSLFFGLSSFVFSHTRSIAFHVFCCQSEFAYRRWLAVDLAGISIGLVGCYVPAIYYGFVCQVLLLHSQHWCMYVVDLVSSHFVADLEGILSGRYISIIHLFHRYAVTSAFPIKAMDRASSNSVLYICRIRCYTCITLGLFA